MKANYHTHTTRCNHANGSDEEYVKSAIKGGYEELGFSDHACWEYNSSFKSRIRMSVKEFDGYYQSISSLKEKYKDQISIKIGMEVEYFPHYMDWMKAFIKEKQLDYIILGNHFYQSDETGVYYGTACEDDDLLTQYVDDCIAGLSTGLYSYLAHPDLFMRGRTKFDQHAYQESLRLCTFCKEHDHILEYNLEGMKAKDDFGEEGYPNPQFWQVAAQVGNKVIIGVDAHENESLERQDYRNTALKNIKSLGLELVDTIPYKF